MNCTEAKKIDIVMTLKKLGFSPIKVTNNEAWFLSPLRKETKPSFKVHKGKNLYFDFGQGQGGNLVDLLVKLIGSVEEALKYLSQNKNSFSFHQPPNNNAVIDNKTIIKKVIDIQHFGLIQYLEKRGIPINIAREFCKEVHYSIGKSNYFGIGFQSNSQSWELRNKYFKSASSPKDITCISYENSTVLIFEGFMDFLSHRVIFPNQTNSDFIICNSTALIKKLVDKLEKYANVELWLDNDNSGKKASEYIKSIHSDVTDKSSFYSGKKDLNEWLISNKNLCN